MAIGPPCAGFPEMASVIGGPRQGSAVALPADRMGIGEASRHQGSPFLIPVDDGARMAKRLEVFQRVAMSVAPVAAFNRLDQVAERNE